MTFSAAMTIVLDMGRWVNGYQSGREGHKMPSRQTGWQVQRGRGTKTHSTSKEERVIQEGRQWAKDIGLEGWETCWTQGSQG